MRIAAPRSASATTDADAAATKPAASIRLIHVVAPGAMAIRRAA